MLSRGGDEGQPSSPDATSRRNLDRLSLAGCSPAEPASVSPAGPFLNVPEFMSSS